MAVKREPQKHPCTDPRTVRLPSRFWIAVNLGILTEEQAQAEWARQQAQGNPLNLRESDSAHA